ncbi:MAG: hypothetical protein K6F20_11610 [Bacteroidaceae bacterium]|nr:hypothetical protein [Bacteroidaceae bacterium]
MKQSCPKCKTLIEINEKEYYPGSTVVKPCPLCDGEVTFNIPDNKTTDEAAITKLSEEVETLKSQLKDINSQKEQEKAMLEAALKEAEERIVRAENTAAEEKEKQHAETCTKGIEHDSNNPPNYNKGRRFSWKWIIVEMAVVIVLAILATINHNGSTKTNEEKITVMDFSGRIGEDYSAAIIWNDSVRIYHFLDYTRDIKKIDFDNSNGHLILFCYEQRTGKYIGKFDGFLDVDYLAGGNGSCGTNEGRYVGDYTNYKNETITFDMKINKVYWTSE